MMSSARASISAKICVIQERSSDATVRSYVSGVLQPLYTHTDYIMGVDFQTAIRMLGPHLCGIKFWSIPDYTKWVLLEHDTKDTDVLVIIPDYRNVHKLDDTYQWIDDYIKFAAERKIPLIILPNSYRETIPNGTLLVDAIRYKINKTYHDAKVLMPRKLMDHSNLDSIKAVFDGIVHYVTMTKYGIADVTHPKGDELQLASAWQRRRHILVARTRKIKAISRPHNLAQTRLMTGPSRSRVRVVPDAAPCPQATSFFDCLCRTFSCLNPFARSHTDADYRELNS